MLFCEIERLREKYIKLLEAVCNIESPTDYKKGIDEVGKIFIEEAERQGWKIELSALENAGNPICITMNDKAKLPPVILSGHLDTVHPLGLFPTPATSVTEEKIYGPGTHDCKGGAIASLMAMEALKNCGFTDRPVKLILQTDEETGSRTSGKKTIEFMIEKSRGAIAFLNTEAIAMDNTVTLARKGIARYQFEVSGQAAHSSSCATLGASAILEASHKIIELEKFKDADGITCNCGTISGGSVPNTVAEGCTFIADFRYADEEQFKTIEKAVSTVAKTVYTHDTTCTAVKISSRPSMPWSDKNLDLFNKINKIYSEKGLPELKYRKGLGGSDAAYITLADIPCIDSIGPFGSGGHTRDEYIYTSELAETARRLAVIVMYI